MQSKILKFSKSTSLVLTLGQKQALYGFVVEAHVAKGDRDAAVAEFEEINKTLNICTHKRTLLCALIKVSGTDFWACIHKYTSHQLFLSTLVQL